MMGSGTKSMFILLPSSSSLTYSWNLGSMLGFIFGLQLFSGLLLVFYYSGGEPFSSVQYLMYEVSGGWFTRCLHFNGASLLFVFLYLHLLKGMFYGSWRLSGTWGVGVSMVILFAGVAFAGYALVYSQMSFWATVVITSLLSALPSGGSELVVWVWGGYGVCISTVKLLFCLHFLLPWLGLFLVLTHLLLLHGSGSSSPLYCHGDYEKVIFYPVFWWKDLFNLVFLVLFFLFFLSFPFTLGDGEMFLVSDSVASPSHIVPEWYFLYSYAILRAVPHKGLGVIFLLLSVGGFIFFILGPSQLVWGGLNSSWVWVMTLLYFLLTWVGHCTPESPFTLLGAASTILFFLIAIFIVSSKYLCHILYSTTSMMNTEGLGPLDLNCSLYHSAHIVGHSIYPLHMGLGLLSMVGSLTLFMKLKILLPLFLSLGGLVFSLSVWVKDVLYEGESGFHSWLTVSGFNSCVLFFIFTEVMFFTSIFWFFFDSFWLGSNCWPLSSGLWLKSPSVALSGTLMLLASSVSGTWAHNKMCNSGGPLASLLLTLALGAMFLFVQLFEYLALGFNMQAGIWGSLFFYGTGFHGFHVLLGLILLSLSSLRLGLGHFSSGSHYMLEASLIYWHFVDVVWLLLYTVLYNWPGVVDYY